MTHQHGVAIVATVTGLLALGIVLAAYGAYRLCRDLAAIADEHRFRRAWQLSACCDDEEVFIPGPRMRAGAGDWLDQLRDDVIADTQPGSDAQRLATCEEIWKHSRKKGWKR